MKDTGKSKLGNYFFPHKGKDFPGFRLRTRVMFHFDRLERIREKYFYGRSTKDSKIEGCKFSI
ncbi:hypothetical protein CH367_18990 [Leptospira barantonii]|uniref:Uncharacterized protein n=1 Tax=Leptospira barantonii TaxID=2023184 RepID=A0ABX4NFN5_9LEPT|nr:hypothetical protein CH367_18990 [Leptospira barantonii]